MRRLEAFFLLGLFLVSGCAANPGANQGAGFDPAQTGGPDLSQPAETGESTIWDGVYTPAQATHGEQIARAQCLNCHVSEEWSNPRYLGVWSGSTVNQLYNNVRLTMPTDAPGSLSREDSAALIAWMLGLMGAPAGDVPLPSDEAGLAAIHMVPSGN